MRMGIAQIRTHFHARDTDQAEPRIIEIPLHDFAYLRAQELTDLLLSPCRHRFATFLGRSAVRPRRNGACDVLECSSDLFGVIELELIPDLNVRESGERHTAFITGLHLAHVILEAFHRRDRAVVHHRTAA